MEIIQQIKKQTSEIISEKYGCKISEVFVKKTSESFEGDYTIVLFQLCKLIKKAPEQIGAELGEIFMTKYSKSYEKFNVTKGYLNLVLL